MILLDTQAAAKAVFHSVCATCPRTKLKSAPH